MYPNCAMQLLRRGHQIMLILRRDAQISLAKMKKPWSLLVMFLNGPQGSQCFSKHDPVDIKHANHMTITTSGQIMSWPDYLKTKGNVNIKLWDLCEILIVYILFSTFQSVHMVLTVNKPDVRRFIAWIESADWNPWIWGFSNYCLK